LYLAHRVTIYGISDLHLDEGPAGRLFEDERQGRELSALCERIAREEDAELILVGDSFDFTAMEPPPAGLARFFRELDIPASPPPRRTLPHLLESVQRHNPVGFEALVKFSRRCRLTVVPGNHDHHLARPEAAQALSAAGLRVNLERSCVRQVGDARVVLQHGHEFDDGNREPGGAGEVMTNVVHQAVIPFLRHCPPPRNVRSDPGRLVALRPEEAVVSVLERWLDEKTFRKFFRAFLRLMAENHSMPRAVSWLAGLVSPDRVRRSVAEHDRLWERAGQTALKALERRRKLPHGAPPPDVLVLGHTHVLDWAVTGQRLYVNLGTWTERAFDANSPRDASLPVLKLDAVQGRFYASLTDRDRELQRFTAGA
jgi:UDP-2,3-diacylglucosamine pyrophosphatase LpxH